MLHDTVLSFARRTTRRWLTRPWVRTSFTNKLSSPDGSLPVADELEARDGLGDVVGLVAKIVGSLPVVGPILLPPLTKVADGLKNSDTAGAESVGEFSVNEQDMATLLKAVDDASGAIQGCIPVNVPTPLKDHLPRDDSAADPSSTSTSDPTTSDSLSPSATDSPPAPPNTPVPASNEPRQLPVHPPVQLPVQPPVNPPAPAPPAPAPPAPTGAPATPAPGPPAGAPGPPKVAELAIAPPVPNSSPQSPVSPPAKPALPANASPPAPAGLPVPVNPPSGAPGSPAAPGSS